MFVEKESSDLEQRAYYFFDRKLHLFPNCDEIIMPSQIEPIHSLHHYQMVIY